MVREKACPIGARCPKQRQRKGPNPGPRQRARKREIQELLCKNAKAKWQEREGKKDTIQELQELHELYRTKADEDEDSWTVPEPTAEDSSDEVEDADDAALTAAVETAAAEIADAEDNTRMRRKLQAASCKEEATAPVSCKEEATAPVSCKEEDSDDIEECIDEADIEEDSDDIEEPSAHHVMLEPSAPDEWAFQDEVEHDVFVIFPKHWDRLALSQKLATFLRYDAIELGWHDGEGWVEVAHACSTLRCTAAQVANVVQRSSRGTDQWGLGPRFERPDPSNSD